MEIKDNEFLKSAGAINQPPFNEEIGIEAQKVCIDAEPTIDPIWHARTQRNMRADLYGVLDDVLSLSKRLTRLHPAVEQICRNIFNFHI